MKRAHASSLTGRQLLSIPVYELLIKLDLENDEEVLKCFNFNFNDNKNFVLIFSFFFFFSSLWTLYTWFFSKMAEIFKRQLYWLRKEDSNVTEITDETEIPHEFLCPITHEIMKEPVQCSGISILLFIYFLVFVFFFSHYQRNISYVT